MKEINHSLERHLRFFLGDCCRRKYNNQVKIDHGGNNKLDDNNNLMMMMMMMMILSNINNFCIAFECS